MVNTISAKIKEHELFNTAKNMLLIMGIVSFFASPIVAVTIAAQTGKEAKIIAEKAMVLANKNANDFAFFKGEVNAKLDIILKNGDAQLQFMSSIERVEDGKD